MRNKHIYTTLLFLSLAFLSFSCQKWTEMKVKNPIKLVGTNKSAQYYEALRAYKKTDHQVAFGWFGNWTGVGTSLQGSFAGLPDSVDFVSMWSNWQHPTKEQLKDLYATRKLKGTKALAVELVFDIGGTITPKISDEELKKRNMTHEQYNYKFWGWSNDNTPEGQKMREEATRRYADSLAAIIYRYKYDGYDIDAEPSYAQPFATKKELWRYKLMSVFIETLGKKIGPMAETPEGREKLFVIDGEPAAIEPKYGKYFNYFILQAYYDGSVPGAYRTNSLVNHFKDFLSAEEVCKKIIYTCDFESGASSGGTYQGQLLSYALYQPVVDGKTYRKGGVGAYHMEYEYKAVLPVSDPKLNTYTVPGTKVVINLNDYKSYTYPFFHAAIQLMNPAHKSEKSTKKAK